MGREINKYILDYEDSTLQISLIAKESKAVIYQVLVCPDNYNIISWDEDISQGVTVIYEITSRKIFPELMIVILDDHDHEMLAAFKLTVTLPGVIYADMVDVVKGFSLEFTVK